MDRAFSAAPYLCLKIVQVLFAIVRQRWILVYTFKSLLYSSDFEIQKLPLVVRPKIIKELVVCDTPNRFPRDKRWKLVGPWFMYGLAYGEGLSMGEPMEFTVT